LLIRQKYGTWFTQNLFTPTLLPGCPLQGHKFQIKDINVKWKKKYVTFKIPFLTLQWDVAEPGKAHGFRPALVARSQSHAGLPEVLSAGNSLFLNLPGLADKGAIYNYRVLSLQHVFI
jgi:hypothetical protein